jgi:hypothetical protein
VDTTMKRLKIIHFILSLIPFTWLILFLYVLAKGTIYLGYIPTEGDLTDPSAIGMNGLTIVIGIGVLYVISASVLWFAIAYILLKEPQSKPKLSRLSVVLHVTGLTGFLLFRFILTGHFGWVLD